MRHGYQRQCKHILRVLAVHAAFQERKGQGYTYLPNREHLQTPELRHGRNNTPATRAREKSLPATERQRIYELRVLCMYVRRFVSHRMVLLLTIRSSYMLRTEPRDGLLQRLN